MKVIWQGKHPLTQVLQDDQGGLRFQYVPLYHDLDCFCSFTLWCEVGDLYRKWFDDFFVEHRLAEEPVTYDGPPYMADRLEQCKTMSNQKADWPNLQEAAKAIQAYAHEHWPDLDIELAMEVKALQFTLGVRVRTREVRVQYAVDLNWLKEQDVRQWVITRIAAAVALPEPFHV